MESAKDSGFVNSWTESLQRCGSVPCEVCDCLFTASVAREVTRSISQSLFPRSLTEADLPCSQFYLRKGITFPREKLAVTDSKTVSKCIMQDV